jgi:phosphatidylserine/phosphatidylglycerophosphate/cardiolipin synthase-like enzyme
MSGFSKVVFSILLASTTTFARQSSVASINSATGLSTACQQRSQVYSLATCLGSPEMNKMLSGLTHADETRNKVELMHLGENSLKRRIEMIKSAEHYVFITTMLWADDPVVEKIEDLLGSKTSTLADFDVRILHDWFFPAKQSNPSNDPHLKSFIKRENMMGWNGPMALRRASFHPLSYHLHDKQFNVDGKKLIIGGMNMGQEYLQGGETELGWHDTDLYIEGPAARIQAENFLKAFEIAAYFESPRHFPPTEKNEIKVLRDYFYDDVEDFSFKHAKTSNELASDRDRGLPFAPQNILKGHFNSYKDSKFLPEPKLNPEHNVPLRVIYDNELLDREVDSNGKVRHFSKVINTLEFLLKNASHQAVLFMPYLSLSSNMMRILNEAAKHLEVIVITNSWQSIDKPKSGSDRGYKTQIINYANLISSGVKLFEWQGHYALRKIQTDNNCKFAGGYNGKWPGDTLHSKIAIIDQSVMMIGSDNMDKRSENFNNEVMTLVRDDGVTKAAYENIWVYDYNLGRLGQSVSCGDKIFIQPTEVERISFEKAAQLYDEHKPSKFMLDHINFYNNIN